MILADTLMLLGDFRGALWEYRRAGDPVGQALALWYMGKPRRALEVLPEGEDELLARMLLALGHPEDVLRLNCSDTVRVWARVMLGDSAALWEAGEDSTLRALAETALATTPRLRDPNLAYGLSVIPGLGQLYAGKPIAALKSLLANALGLGLFGYSVARREWVDAALVGWFLGVRFYQGGAYNAYSLVLRESEETYRTWLEGLKGRFPYPEVPLLPVKSRGGASPGALGPSGSVPERVPAGP